MTHSLSILYDNAKITRNKTESIRLKPIIFQSHRVPSHQIVLPHFHYNTCRSKAAESFWALYRRLIVVVFPLIVLQAAWTLLDGGFPGPASGFQMVFMRVWASKGTCESLRRSNARDGFSCCQRSEGTRERITVEPRSRLQICCFNL